MDDKRIDIWFQAYLDNRRYARFHAGQRATVSNIILTITAAIVAVLIYDDAISTNDIAPLLLIAAINVYGFVFSAKLAERERLHLSRGYSYLDAMDEIQPDLRMGTLKGLSDKEHQKEYRVLYPLRMTDIWNTFHLIIAVVSFICAFALRT